MNARVAGASPPTRSAPSRGWIPPSISDVSLPALHASPVRPDEARPRSAAAWHRTPAHDRREPDDELRDRRRVPRRAARVPEPEQVALHRVHLRLEPVVARCRAARRGTGATEQRAHDQATRFGRQRLDPAAPPAPAARAARSSSLADGRSRCSWEAPETGRARPIRRTAEERDRAGTRSLSLEGRTLRPDRGSVRSASHGIGKTRRTGPEFEVLRSGLYEWRRRELNPRPQSRQAGVYERSRWSESRLSLTPPTRL